MTINSINLDSSQPFSGLGTATFNVVTTGLYNLSFKSSLPYFPAGSQPQSSVPVNGSVNVTCAADTAGSRNNTYWVFYSAGNLRGFYVWFNINAAGTDPAVAGLTGIEVAGATGATAATLATASIAAINANTTAAAYVFASAGASGHLILRQNFPGSYTAAANGAGGASAGATFSATAGTYGVPEISGLQVVCSNGATILGRWGNPTPNQPILGGQVEIQATAADVLTLVFSSLSNADANPNAVKTIINLFKGE